MNSLIVRYHARTLWMQTLLLLMGSIAGAALLTGPILLKHFDGTAQADLEKKGRATVQTLAKDYELRLAISLRDAAQADPILRKLKQTDEEIRYVAITKGREVIAVSPATTTKDEILAHIEPFMDNVQVALPPTKETKRYTEVIAAQKSAFEGDSLLGEETKKSRKEEPGFVILGLSTQRAQAKVWEQTLASVAAVSLCVFMVGVLLFLRWVARRMNKMVIFAKAVASGQLQQRLDDPLQDELGQLSAALTSMAQRTSDIVGEMLEASRAIASAATEILDSSTRQAQNANQQATSVTQMGATVAELRQTFTEATSKAESVIDLARRSEESSTGGGAAVKESIDGMGHLRDQVSAISHTIQGLLERTDQIHAIIEVVNDLAEQSNVLAVNAGIEAARAGEHGRGFSIVAREVRSLSERSKESTAEVRTILQDIRLAGRESAKVIDEGSRRADRGMQLANAAGESILRLGDTIVSSSAAAMQIATLTRQQSVGIDQIWQATKGLDQIARETARGIQQIETASANLKALSFRLTELVGRYQV
ncbi:MAG TPA: methyl-accepting chemotaxis protein [Pseudomonadota bacterium]|nr:methyl-accepting chemotaxis protein [Pseudomonadota bacterium]